jgi:glyoxylase-like metal-dependent hydrolase (beta-lactamase superfamily II)
MNHADVFYQLYEAESSTYTYLVGDRDSKEAVIIDSVLETVDRDLKLIQELGLTLKYILDTHVHADHITGAGRLRDLTGAKSAMSLHSKVKCVDISLNDRDTLKVGKTEIQAIYTPGHTDSCMSYLIGNRVFTGDALLIRGTGRTDFQGGSSETLYDSIHNKLFSLTDHTEVYPGHDYRGQTKSTVGLEKQYNPRVGNKKSKSDFIKIMSELSLANPKKIHEALPANLSCGVVANQKSRDM